MPTPPMSMDDLFGSTPLIHKTNWHPTQATPLSLHDYDSAFSQYNMFKLFVLRAQLNYFEAKREAHRMRIQSFENLWQEDDYSSEVQGLKPDVEALEIKLTKAKQKVADCTRLIKEIEDKVVQEAKGSRQEGALERHPVKSYAGLPQVQESRKSGKDFQYV